MKKYLMCTVTKEVISSNKSDSKKIVFRNSNLTLGRNEFQDIILKIETSSSQLPMTYVIQNIAIHKKFLKDGKASIHLRNEECLLLLSNCPPKQLTIFLKKLLIKYHKQKQNGICIKQRTRLLSKRNRTFQEISPLCMKDIHSKKQEKEKCTLKFLRQNLEKKADAIETTETNLKSSSLRLLSTVVMNKEQKQIMDAVLSGRNIFFTGSAGTGKSFILRKIVGILPPEVTFVTASTGIAASHICGTTLHSFAGIGSGSAPIEQCLELAQRKIVAQQWKKCCHLIIDEISMVDGKFFQKLEYIARKVRNNDKPFGGIQMILCGDFFQLPPVSKSNQKALFCFQTPAWRRSVELYIELTKVYRQSDQDFISILQEIRIGRCSEKAVKKLQATLLNKIDKDGIIATKLCTHKEDVENINQKHLDQLCGSVRTFNAIDSDSCFTTHLDQHCPINHQLQLKIGTQVMLTKNLDVQRGLVNGARGVVTGFETGTQGLPIVKFMSGLKESLKYEKWIVKFHGEYVSRHQLPLTLAWAISIHKSQGMTLDCVEISLSRVFEYGQAYVALSRAQNLEGLRIVGFYKECIRAHPDVLKFYRQLQKLKDF